MAEMTVRLIFEKRWWLRLYLFGLVACYRLTGREPDMGKVRPWIYRGLIVRVEREH